MLQEGIDGRRGGREPRAMPALECRFCGHTLAVSDPIPRDAECPGCGRDLRCCRQCRHYDPSRNNECRESEAELVVEKDRRNFCEFFEFDRRPRSATGGGDRAAEARAKLAGLFGEAPGSAPPVSDARKRLEDLFKKDPDKGA